MPAGYIDKLNFINKQDLKHLKESEIRPRVTGNYLCRLRTLTKTAIETSSMSRMFDAMFGNEWYLQPHQKLVKAVMLCERKAGVHSMPCNYFTQADVKLVLAGRRRQQWLEDNSLTRICKRFYSAKAVDEVIEQCLWTENTSWYQSSETIILNAAKVAAFIRRYDKKDVKQLKRVKDADALRNIAGCADNARLLKDSCYGRDLRQAMSEKQVSELANKMCRMIIATSVGDKTDKYWGQKEEQLIRQLMWAYGRVSCANFSCARAFEAAAKSNIELNKAYEMHELSKLFNVECADAHCTPWRANRISSKLYRLMKQLKAEYDKGTPLDILQQILERRSHIIANETYNRCIIAPYFDIKGDK